MQEESPKQLDTRDKKDEEVAVSQKTHKQPESTRMTASDSDNEQHSDIPSDEDASRTGTADWWSTFSVALDKEALEGNQHHPFTRGKNVCFEGLLETCSS